MPDNPRTVYNTGLGWMLRGAQMVRSAAKEGADVDQKVKLKADIVLDHYQVDVVNQASGGITSRGMVLSERFLDEVMALLGTDDRAMTAKDISSETGKSIDYVRDQLAAFHKDGLISRIERKGNLGHLYVANIEEEA